MLVALESHAEESDEPLSQNAVLKLAGVKKGSQFESAKDELHELAAGDRVHRIAVQHGEQTHFCFSHREQEDSNGLAI